MPKICVALNEMTEAGLLIKTLNYQQGTKKRYTYTVNKKVMDHLQKVYGTINQKKTAPLTKGQSNNKEYIKDGISHSNNKIVGGSDFSERENSLDYSHIKDDPINQKEMVCDCGRCAYCDTQPY